MHGTLSQEPNDTRHVHDELRASSDNTSSLAHLAHQPHAVIREDLNVPEGYTGEWVGEEGHRWLGK